MAQLGDELCACPDWTPLEPRFRSRGRSLKELVSLPEAGNIDDHLFGWQTQRRILTHTRQSTVWDCQFRLSCFTACKVKWTLSEHSLSTACSKWTIFCGFWEWPPWPCVAVWQSAGAGWQVDHTIERTREYMRFCQKFALTKYVLECASDVGRCMKPAKTIGDSQKNDTFFVCAYLRVLWCGHTVCL